MVKGLKQCTTKNIVHLAVILKNEDDNNKLKILSAKMPNTPYLNR